jgi:hypothetical protein
VIRSTIAQVGTGVTSGVIQGHSKRRGNNGHFFGLNLDCFGPFSSKGNRIAAPPTGIYTGRYGAYVCGVSLYLSVKIGEVAWENVIWDKNNAIFRGSFAAPPLSANMPPQLNNMCNDVYYKILEYFKLDGQ